MQLKENKTDYQISTRSMASFSTRLTVNNRYIERNEVSLLLEVWPQEDGGWDTNTEQLCKKAYVRISMLTKLRYASFSIEDLLHIYNKYIKDQSLNIAVWYFTVP